MDADLFNWMRLKLLRVWSHIMGVASIRILGSSPFPIFERLSYKEGKGERIGVATPPHTFFIQVCANDQRHSRWRQDHPLRLTIGAFLKYCSKSINQSMRSIRSIKMCALSIRHVYKIRFKINRSSKQSNQSKMCAFNIQRIYQIWFKYTINQSSHSKNFFSAMTKPHLESKIIQWWSQR